MLQTFEQVILNIYIFSYTIYETPCTMYNIQIAQRTPSSTFFPKAMENLLVFSESYATIAFRQRNDNDDVKRYKNSINLPRRVSVLLNAPRPMT